MSYFQESSDLKVKEKVLEVYGKTLEVFENDVENVKVWLKTQPHLPQVLSEYFWKNRPSILGEYFFSFS